jgi:hypothetical protein
MNETEELRAYLKIAHEKAFECFKKLVVKILNEHKEWLFLDMKCGDVFFVSENENNIPTVFMMNGEHNTNPHIKAERKQYMQPITDFLEEFDLAFNIVRKGVAIFPNGEVK